MSGCPIEPDCTDESHVAALSDWERERRDSVPFMPPAETQQDDEMEAALRAWQNTGAGDPAIAGPAAVAFRAGYRADRLSADAEALRRVRDLADAMGEHQPITAARLRAVLDGGR